MVKKFVHKVTRGKKSEMSPKIETIISPFSPFKNVYTVKLPLLKPKVQPRLYK